MVAPASTPPGGAITAKAALFDQAARVLKPGGVLAGATILASGPGVQPNRLARTLMRVYNGQANTFHNAGDTQADLEAALSARFDRVDVRVHGCVAVWRGAAR